MAKKCKTGKKCSYAKGSAGMSLQALTKKLQKNRKIKGSKCEVKAKAKFSVQQMVRSGRIQKKGCNLVLAKCFKAKKGQRLCGAKKTHRKRNAKKCGSKKRRARKCKA